MLTIPTKGFGKSVSKHNIRLDVLCDWIEATVLFHDTDTFLSQIDIADVLLEEERYVEQEFAMIGMKDAWSELNKRVSWIGTGSVVQLNGKRIQRIHTDWRDNPAYAFCLLLSLAPFYDWWKENNYTNQGELFELITEASLKAQLNDWQVCRTGWSKDNPVTLRNVAMMIVDHLSETLGDIETWDGPYAKELGLDILLYRPFSDNRRGISVYLMQCASGNDWDLKLHTPDLNKWHDIIHFKNTPLKAFATPFTFLDREYTKCVSAVGGLFLERCRLLGASRYNINWLDEELKQRLIEWCEPKVNQLLLRSR